MSVTLVPPPFASWLLRLLYRGEAGAEVAADLREEFFELAMRSGERTARGWYRRQVLASIGAHLLPRFFPRPNEGAPRMSGIWFDIRYSFRLLARRQRFAAAALVTLALGVGANAVVFAVLDAVVLRPLPFSAPDRLVALRQFDAGPSSYERISPATYLDWVDAEASFEAMTAVRPWSFPLERGGQRQTIPAGLVTETFFDVLGVSPAAGRALAPEDYQAGPPRVVVISHALWQRAFGGDLRVLDQPHRFAEQTLTIVGIMPESFRWLDRTQEMWSPFLITERARTQRVQTYITAVGRLSPGRTVAQSAGEAEELGRRLAAEHPTAYRDRRLTTLPVSDDVAGPVKQSVLLLFGAAGALSLIAFANVAGLLLMRGAERQRELDVRAAVGAGRWRITRQLAIENMILIGAGATLGLVAAVGGLQWLVASVPFDVPRLEEAAISWRTALYSFGLAGMLFVLFALLRPQGTDRNFETLRGGVSTSRRRSRTLQRWLVTSEIALAVLLISTASALARSLVGVLDVDPGFSKTNVTLIETHVWSTAPRPEQQAAYFAQALDAIRRVPGVTSAGAVSSPPFLGGPSIDIETIVRAPSREPAPAWLSVASSGYVETMGIRLIEGRAFVANDRPGGEPVALVSEGLARRLFTGSAVGQSLHVANERTPVPVKVVGVVGDVRHIKLEGEVRPEVFVPLAQVPFGSMNLVVRTDGPPSASIGAIRAAVQSLNPSQPITDVRLLESLVDDTVAPRRFYVWLSSSFALTALVLAAVGLYGLISLATAERTREIGLRVALGSRPRQVLALVLRSTIAPATVGLAAGLLCAIASSRWLASTLFAASLTDVTTIAIASLVVLVTTMAAVLGPVRRALSIDPIIAIREE